MPCTSFADHFSLPFPRHETIPQAPREYSRGMSCSVCTLIGCWAVLPTRCVPDLMSFDEKKNAFRYEPQDQFLGIIGTGDDSFAVYVWGGDLLLCCVINYFVIN